MFTLSWWPRAKPIISCPPVDCYEAPLVHNLHSRYCATVMINLKQSFAAHIFELLVSSCTVPSSSWWNGYMACLFVGYLSNKWWYQQAWSCASDWTFSYRIQTQAELKATWPSVMNWVAAWLTESLTASYLPMYLVKIYYQLALLKLGLLYDKLSFKSLKNVLQDIPWMYYGLYRLHMAHSLGSVLRYKALVKSWRTQWSLPAPWPCMEGFYPSS